MTRLGQNGDPKRCRTPTWIRAKKTWISCQIWEWVTCGNSKIPKSTSIWCLDVQCILDQGNPLEWAYFFCSLLVSDSKSLPKWILRSWKAGSILFFLPILIHPTSYGCPTWCFFLGLSQFFRGQTTRIWVSPYQYKHPISWFTPGQTDPWDPLRSIENFPRHPGI